MTGTTALIVIDTQLCAFDGKITQAIHKGEELLGEIVKLVTAAREADVPVIFVQHCAPDGLPFAKGTHGWEIHPLVSPTSVEIVVNKRQSSAFDDTELENVLAEARIDTIINCGIQSEFCVANTSISALELGLSVYVAQDAHGTVSTEEETASTIIARQNVLLSEKGAQVQSTTLLMGLISEN